MNATMMDYQSKQITPAKDCIAVHCRDVTKTYGSGDAKVTASIRPRRTR